MNGFPQPDTLTGTRMPPCTNIISLLFGQRTALVAMVLFALAAAPTAAIVLKQGNPFQQPASVSPAPIAAPVQGLRTLPVLLPALEKPLAQKVKKDS